ncbi:hypothetical protein PUV54_13030 [Hyphococcus flavus]|uniref:Uncharacterized protein n=1 Tax=Hyphococcus flavus TaxID=1866326 RepID=A0AAE9ZAT2_9PROT|nr:hypothetical protein [Hyphococcus flavus]WDI30878.1 hypothetical protein PUV54_13030 [Hyphococcus flavus]
MKRVFPALAASTVFAFTLSCVSASSQVAPSGLLEFGDYDCSIDEAKGISPSGEDFVIENTPSTFTFSFYESPVTPMELNDGGPYRSLDRDLSGETNRYEPEPPRKFSASISPDIFAIAADRLRTSNMEVFYQDSITIEFESDLSYLAYGPARSGGVSVFAGACRRS